MTDEIAPRDAYATETAATVTGVNDEGVVLDRTVFYSRGGGQPGDTGVLEWDGGSVPVTDTYKRSGVVLHVVDGAPPPVGTELTARIDWERRHLLMRTHTALHVLTAVIFRDFAAKVTGGNMEPGRARMDFELDSSRRTMMFRCDSCPVPMPWRTPTSSEQRSISYPKPSIQFG
jgi:misacylated tRNA(Ala) deacylase